MEQELKLLRDGAALSGVDLSDSALSAFETFTKELLRVNQHMNLTAITEESEIVTKHYLDSLAPLKTGLFTKGARVIDVGCGAGFPSMPLKLARDDLSMTFLDGMGKRIEFLKGAGELLGISGAEYLHLRAEEGARKEGLRESFDIAVSRAVSALPVLCELCLPYVKPGGYFIALKGPDPKEEIESAKGAIGVLGGRLAEVTEAPLYSTRILHSLVVIEKVKACDGKYPRPFARISKNPL